MDRVKELVSRAKALGVPGSLIRASLNDADKLAEIVKSAEKGARANRPSKMKSSKGGSKVARPVAKAKANKAKAVTPKRRGRPVGSKNKPKTTTKTTARKSTPVRKPTRTTARKPAPKTTARKPARKDEAGRNTIDNVDFRITDNWNPREGSAVETIWLALKKAKGDREKAFQALKPRVWEFVGKTKADNTKRPRNNEPGGAYHMLRYRISRTLFDFAIQTGQHESSKNREPYGSVNGTKSKPARKAAVKAAATKRTPARKPATKATTARRGPGRPKGSTNKPKATTRRRTAGRR
jgi:hypothetical protein